MEDTRKQAAMEDELRKLEADLAGIEDELSSLHHRMIQPVPSRGPADRKRRRSEGDKERGRPKRRRSDEGEFDIEAALVAETEDTRQQMLSGRKRARKEETPQVERAEWAQVYSEAREAGLAVCGGLLDELLAHEYAAPFAVPVDPVAHGCPDYFDVIKQPADLGTIAGSLRAKAYTSVHEVAEEVRLVWRNALAYNPPDSELYVMAQTLYALSEEGLLKALHAEGAQAALSREELRKAMESVRERMSKLELQLRELRTNGLVWTKDPALMMLYGATDPRIPRREDVDARPLSPPEKSALTEAIERLSGPNLRAVVQVLEEEMPHLLRDDMAEFELDLDQLDTMTLARLVALCHNLGPA